MLNENELQKINTAQEQWEQGSVRKTLERSPERKERFANISDISVKRLYGPSDVADLDYLRDLGFPGEYPYIRGIYPTMHRGRLWTMRMFAGFGSAEESNARYRFLLEQGQTGLSVAFDMPTLYGLDTDDSQAAGEFGKCGVAVSSLADMEILFDQIPVDDITTSMTINGPAAVIWAMYIVMAERKGVPMAKLGGTIQNDILKEYHAQKEFLYPPQPSMRLVIDTFEFGAQRLPRWNTVSISGYHIREAGATAVQELAFTLADGFAYVEAALARGLEIDSFAPRLSFFFNAHNDFFEEIAKYRAARRIWARLMREKYGAKNPESWKLRFHTQTAGCTLTAEQPENNVARVTLQALAAVLGGTQSLHTNSMDEALALPSELAVRVALRTQQIIAHESGVVNSCDPLGGSYYIEAMTDQMEKAAYKYFQEIEARGGVVGCINNGYIQKEIADAAARYQCEIDVGERILVGVNEFKSEEPVQIPLLRMDPEGERRHLARLERVRRERDNKAVEQRLEGLRMAAQSAANVMPSIIEAVRVYATLGEICQVFREVFGEYREAPVI
ncbi:MAG: methylmalonyl-CoA mutase [Chloroflexota bacterium]|nr:MAG: methylmalonyl-CoA mutase [Chloroflexota bacterium]